jgi:hypothetical protein
MTGQTNGLEPPVCIKDALSMSKQELDQYEALVLKGGEVTADGLRAKIEVAAFFGFCLHWSTYGGNRRNQACQRAAYTRDLRKVWLRLHSYRGELGYLYAEPECRKRHLCCQNSGN